MKIPGPKDIKRLAHHLDRMTLHDLAILSKRFTIANTIHSAVKHYAQIRRSLQRRRQQEQHYINLQKRFGELQAGVTLIVPTYKGEKRIEHCLHSLVNQTLPRSRFEIIFVINGERDNTDQKIRSIFSEAPDISFSILYQQRASLAAARNVGIRAAQRKFVCFLDDDDFLSANYLEEMLAIADDFTIVLSQICDVHTNGLQDLHNPINKELTGVNHLSACQIHHLARGASMAGGKLLSTTIMKTQLFDEELKSGEDTAYFSQLVTDWDFTFRMLPPRKAVIYYRSLRENSLSRQPLTYEFNVRQRLAILEHLEHVMARCNEDYQSNFIRLRISAQASFIAQYLRQHPEARDEIAEEIVDRKLFNFPFQMINKNQAKDLVISYCFPPNLDSSGIVAAKRIRQQGTLVDVICNRLDEHWLLDTKLSLLADHFIDTKFRIPTPTTFQRWRHIEKFIRQGMHAIDKQVGLKGPYGNMYSRVMYPASHLLACACKLKYPETTWTAEFSDPLLYDIHDDERFASMGRSRFLRNVNSAIQALGEPTPKSRNLFFYVEYLAFLFADHIIFTNETQKTYMLDRFPIKHIADRARNKSSVQHQPVPPARCYHLCESKYTLDRNVVNVGYFGTFYETRTLADLVLSISELDEATRNRLKIHVFTNRAKILQQHIRTVGLQDIFSVNALMGYFECLNLSTKVDCLIVNDAITKPLREVNPYLPSKLSDYRGSGTPIWGICEHNSELSRMKLDYMSFLGDLPSISHVLKTLANQVPLSNKATNDV